MPTLYVSQPGSSIRRTSRRLVVAHAGSVTQTVPLREVERVVVVGRVSMTQPALAMLLEQGIETSFLAPSGRLVGRLVPAEGKNVFLRVAQVQKWQDMEFRLSTARRLVDAKMAGGRRVLQLFARLRDGLNLSGTLEGLKGLRSKVATQTTMPAVMGVEGEGAALYFRAFGSLFLGKLSFSTRSRRPPLDPVNSLLSLGYTLLTTEATGALASRGLDPYIGLLHDLDYGRVSLALDLIEPFRHPVVDRLALSLINRRILKEDDFEHLPNRGVMLKDEPRRRFFAFYDRMMETPFTCAGTQVTWRKLLDLQAGQLSRHVLGLEEFTPHVFH